jgi:hypothetical protein
LAILFRFRKLHNHRWSQLHLLLHQSLLLALIDEHGLKIQGRGYLRFLHGGVKAFQTKLSETYFGFYCIWFLTNLPRGSYAIPP